MRRPLAGLLFLIALGTAEAAAPAPVTAMVDGVLSATYPALRRNIAFEHGRFSADGTRFAFSISQVASGDPEQVWLYDLHSHALVAATPGPVPSVTGYTIDDFAWDASGVLYISGQRTEWKDQSRNGPLRIAATASRSTVIADFPPAMVQAFARQALPTADAEFADERIERNARFTVTLSNKGHGLLNLSARNNKTGKAIRISEDSWGLASFVFDAARSRVHYATQQGIATFDLNSGTAHLLSIGSGRIVVNLLDISADGTLLAYSVRGSCDPSRPAAPGDVAGNICFVRLP